MGEELSALLLGCLFLSCFLCCLLCLFLCCHKIFLKIIFVRRRMIRPRYFLKINFQKIFSQRSIAACIIIVQRKCIRNIFLMKLWKTFSPQAHKNIFYFSYPKTIFKKYFFTQNIYKNKNYFACMQSNFVSTEGEQVLDSNTNAYVSGTARLL